MQTGRRPNEGRAPTLRLEDLPRAAAFPVTVLSPMRRDQAVPGPGLPTSGRPLHGPRSMGCICTRRRRRGALQWPFLSMLRPEAKRVTRLAKV